MSVNAMTIKGIITGIGFAPQDGKDGIYYKCYSSCPITATACDSEFEQFCAVS